MNRTVTRISERRQRPEVNAGSSDLVIAIADREPAPAAEIDIPTLRMHFARGSAPFDFRGVSEAGERRAADLVYDVAAGVLIYKTGDVVGEFDPSENSARLGARLQGAIDKWRLIELLTALDSSGDPELLLSDGDRVYRDGEEVEFSIRSDHHGHVTLFNLAYDGTVQLVAPSGPGYPGLAGGRLRIGEQHRERVRVIPPFGSDHLVAVTTKADLPEFDDAVFAMDGERVALELAEELKSMLESQEFGIDWVGLYTRQ